MGETGSSGFDSSAHIGSEITRLGSLETTAIALEGAVTGAQDDIDALSGTFVGYTNSTEVVGRLGAHADDPDNPDAQNTGLYKLLADAENEQLSLDAALNGKFQYYNNGGSAIMPVSIATTNF